jgi:hypothetical protein
MQKYLKKSLFIGFLAIVVVFSMSLKPENFHDKNYNTNLQIINNKNSQISNFKIRIVNDEKNREIGLMFVKSLPLNYGMLFEFEKERMVYMWMKNTEIPLDMMFIDKNDRIINIKHHATPESLETISSGKEVVKVLEINGGLCDKLGIEINDKIVVVSN